MRILKIPRCLSLAPLGLVSITIRTNYRYDAEKIKCARTRKIRGRFVYVWPAHFPIQCPPDHATGLHGTVYRFINGPHPTEWDFLSHYERAPTKLWGDACKARGLSVVRTLEDCEIMREGVPALRKKRIAVADISIPVGVVANTPSKTCVGHCTWWRGADPGAVKALFAPAHAE